MLKIIKLVKCNFIGHKFEKAGSCPFTGKSYNYCIVCQKVVEANVI
jgi:hypothetical protein